MSAYEASEGTRIEWDEIAQAEVLPKCDDTTAPGHWVCLTHRESFPHNLAMHSHSMDGEHVIAWRCSAHGIEVP